MSWQDCPAPTDQDAPACPAVEMTLVPRTHDIGGFEVRRALPSRHRRMVGPFIFFDEMGPSEFLIGNGIDVRPHPHIGLSTVTYLFDGQIYHRDSLGTALPIDPGAVNWMTAGRGIVHSERTSPERRETGQRLFGLQAWVALPAGQEEAAPAFSHTAAADLPILDGEGKQVRVIAGHFAGASSPVPVSSPMVYADIELAAGASVEIDAEMAERALYPVDGEIDIAGDRFGPHQLLILRPGDIVTVRATQPSRFMLLGGEPMDGPRHIWWNFVSSRKDRIDQAKADWTGKRFALVPGDSEEFIPLPD